MKLIQKGEFYFHQISYSELSCYHFCSQKWFLRYVKKLRSEQKGENLIIGSALHYALEMFFIKYNGYKIDTIKKLENIFIEYLLEQYQTYIKSSIEQAIPSKKLYIENSYKLIEPTITGFLDWLYENFSIVNGEPEAKKMKIVNPEDDQKFGIFGIIDLLNKDEFIDWKTCSQKKKNLAQDHKMQMLFYMFISDLNHGSMVYLQKNSMEKSLELSYTKKEKDDLFVKDYVKYTCKLINTGIFPPSGLAKTDYFNHCPKCEFWRGNKENIKEFGLNNLCKYSYQ